MSAKTLLQTLCHKPFVWWRILIPPARNTKAISFGEIGVCDLPNPSKHKSLNHLTPDLLKAYMMLGLSHYFQNA